MVQRSYPKRHDPKSDMEPLRATYDYLKDLQRQTRPFGRDYLAIAIALDGLGTCAFHFTRDPTYFGTTGNHSG